jgi:predicted ATP-grasp superfamily ATP-dependent carboligase
MLLGPSPGAVALTADKLTLARLWAAAGVPTPPTYPGTPPPPPPWVVKPRDGCGSAGVALADAVPDGMVAQPFIRGVAASVAFVICDGPTVALAPAAQHLDDSFRYRGGSAPLPAALTLRAAAVARRAVDAVRGLAGYVGVDVILGDDGRDWAVEINPRLTTSYVGLRVLALDNLAEMMLAAARHETVNPPRWREGQVTWTADGRYVHSRRNTE